MIRISISRQVKYWLIAQVTAAVLYYSSIKMTRRVPAELALTYIDKAVGFHAIWGWVYISFFILLMIALLKAPVAISKRCAIVWILNTIVACACFYFVPTKMPFEYVNDPVKGCRIMKLIWLVDGNYNCFPSLHIANSLAVTYFFNLKRVLPVKILFWTWCMLITYSVLSIKQHYFYDILGGVWLAFINVLIVKWIYQSPQENPGLVSTRVNNSKKGKGISVFS
jgi:membrane-associated phospholipid phosphatase